MQDNKNTQNTLSSKVAISSRARELYLQTTYDEFILWYALPGHEKAKMGIERQGDFADYHKLSERSLVRWKQRPDFYIRVQSLRAEWAKSRTSDVIAAMYKSALSSGPGAPIAQKLWMQVFEGFSEKSEVEHSAKVEVGINDIRFIINGLPEPHRSKFYGYIDEIVATVDQTRINGTFEDAEWTPQLEAPISDDSDQDAREVSDTGANEVPESDTDSIRVHLVGSLSARNYQSAQRRWQEQAPRNDWI
jgi:hypothetical protein